MSNPISVPSKSPPPSTLAMGQAPDERPHVQFPWRLHELLTQAETNGNDSIISWLPGTNAFKVHNKQGFATEILPAYFNATKYKSFQRNLNLWGFETITEGPNKGGCYHPLFIRGDREKCHYMTRQKVKGNKLKQTSSPTQRPKGENDDSDGKESVSNLASLTAQPPNVQVQQFIQDLKKLPFPKKIHHILSQPAFEDSIRWTPDGRCVRVVDPFRFQEVVAPHYFTHNSFSSFLVELESYGFKKLAHAGFHECYYHDLMIRDCAHLCKYMATPEDSKRFVSENPRKDLAKDPELRHQVPPAPTASLGPNMSHLVGGGAGLSLPDQATLNGTLQQLLQSRQQQQQQQQQSNIGPLLQLLSGQNGAEANAAASNALGLNTLTSQLLAAGGAANRRSSMSQFGLTPSQTTATSSSSPVAAAAAAAAGESQNRSAIAAFLANSTQMGGESLLRNAGLHLRNN